MKEVNYYSRWNINCRHVFVCVCVAGKKPQNYQKYYCYKFCISFMVLLLFFLHNNGKFSFHCSMIFRFVCWYNSQQEKKRLEQNQNIAASLWWLFFVVLCHIPWIRDCFILFGICCCYWCCLHGFFFSSFKERYWFAIKIFMNFKMKIQRNII